MIMPRVLRRSSRKGMGCRWNAWKVIIWRRRRRRRRSRWRWENGSSMCCMLRNLRGICALQGSGVPRLDSLSIEELRYNAVGRALVTKEKACEMARDELEELMEPFAYGITRDTNMLLHPFKQPTFTLSEVSQCFLEFLLLLEITLLTSLSLSLYLWQILDPRCSSCSCF